MVKKLFALASVTALTGLMAAVAASGCSSSTVVEPGPTAEAGPDGKVPPRTDAEPDEDADVDSGPASCPTTTPITATDIGLTWLPPGPIQDVCSQQNLDDLKALFDKGKGSAKYSEIETTLGAACAPCVFTASKGARWGVIIKDGTQIVADNSTGSCFGQLSTAECGKAFFELDACNDIVCPKSECGDDTSACTSKAAKGACKSYLATVQKDCPDIQTLADNCTNFVRIIEVSCGGGPDGGKDSSL